MLQVQIDEETVREVLNNEIRRAVETVQVEKTLWDFKELERQTCMGKSNILEKFFWDQEFPKFKVGQKWMFPAKETQEYLLRWLRKQPRH
ncbi:hypothetical protein ABE042_04980 [Viridibacillus arvi]|uniref:hypothetical protein n=1 Tax=Viridibacillus arvi TaxID=263475 RepID=UPI003D273995